YPSAPLFFRGGGRFADIHLRGLDNSQLFEASFDLKEIAGPKSLEDDARLSVLAKQLLHEFERWRREPFAPYARAGIRPAGAWTLEVDAARSEKGQWQQA